MTVPSHELLRVANLLNITDQDLARVLNVPVRTVFQWRECGRMTRKLAPAFAALVEATYTKSFVDFDRACAPHAKPHFEQHLRDIAEQVRNATKVVKADQLLRRRYQQIITRMLDALGREDHAARLTPRARGIT